MGVVDIRGDADWNTQMRNAGGKLVVADFSAKWCGPCQMIKPVFEQYSRQYSDVVFLGIDESENKSLISSLGVRGFPTFHFYLNQRKVDELVGADPNALRQKIEQWRQSAFNPFASEGMTLGGSAGATPVDPREARLKRLANMNILPTNTQATASPPAAPAASNVTGSSEKESVDDTSAMVCDPATGVCRNVPATEEAESQLPPVNDALLSELLTMGFSDIRSRKALLATDSQGIELAINWISEHQEDPDIDEPIQFMDMAAAGMGKKPLTAEEKEAKVAELKIKMEQKRREREEREKQEKIASELKRRTMGHEIQAAREQYEDIQRKVEAEKRKKEKEDAKRERERVRKLLEQDKRERRARGGRLGGPPIDLDDEKYDEVAAPEEKKEAKTTKVSSLSPEEQITSSLDKLKQYRVANDGLTACKTLAVYVKNLLEKPHEDKFRTINLENAAFRKRVGSFVGGISLLKGLGFEKDSSSNTLLLDVTKRDENLLRFAQQKLQMAITELS